MTAVLLRWGGVELERDELRSLAADRPVRRKARVPDATTRERDYDEKRAVE